MMKSKIAVFIVMLIIFTYGISAIFLFNVLQTGISAFEGKAVADRLANEWNQEAALQTIISTSDLKSDGKASTWVYIYTCSPNDTLEECRIKVNRDLSTEQEIIYLPYAGDSHPLVNMTLDSTSAMCIAIANQTFNKFIDDYGYWAITMNLKIDNSSPIWSIRLDASVLENYYYAGIDINATNGDIINLDTTESGGTSHKEFNRSISTFCFACIMIIVVIHVTIVYVVILAGKKKQSQQQYQNSPPLQPPFQYPPNNRP